MAKKKMKAQAESRPISAKELKFWLEGILEFQDDKWIPNAVQWKSIQDKIFNLEETQQYASPVFNRPVPANGGAGAATTFLEDTFESSEISPAAPAPSFDSVPPVVPVRDANGFLTMPENFNISGAPVQASGAKHKFNPNGFE